MSLLYVSFLQIAAQIAILFFYYNFDVSLPSEVKECKGSIDSNISYESLFMKSVGYNFFVPPSMVPQEYCEIPLTAGPRSCGQFLSANKIPSERSSCPWYVNVIHDPTIFPPRRTEAVCRCDSCTGALSHHECKAVFAKMTFLKRTDECIDGLYMYAPKVMHVAVACACVSQVKGKDTDLIFDYNYERF